MEAGFCHFGLILLPDLWSPAVGRIAKAEKMIDCGLLNRYARYVR